MECLWQCIGSNPGEASAPNSLTETRTELRCSSKGQGLISKTSGNPISAVKKSGVTTSSANEVGTLFKRPAFMVIKDTEQLLLGPHVWFYGKTIVSACSGSFLSRCFYRKEGRAEKAN